MAFNFGRRSTKERFRAAPEADTAGYSDTEIDVFQLPEDDANLQWLFNEADKEASFLDTKFGRVLSASDMEHLADICLNFCKMTTEKARGGPLRPNQEEFVWKILHDIVSESHSKITGLWSRQSGKTECLATVAGPMSVFLPILANHIEDDRIWKFHRGLWLAFYAPVGDQAFIPFNRMCALMHSPAAHTVLLDPDINLVWSESPEKKPKNAGLLYLPNGSKLLYSGTPKQKQVEGKTHHVIFIDEAHDMDTSIVRESLHPMCSATLGTIVKCGVAGERRCDFSEQIKNNQIEDAKLTKRKFRNHFEYDWSVTAKYDYKYAVYIKDEIRDLGYNSDEFKRAYRLIWTYESGQAISEDWMRTAANPELGITTKNHGRPYVGGIDVGRVNNPTVLTLGYLDTEGEYGAPRDFGDGDVRHHKVIVNWYEPRAKDDFEKQVEEIMDFLANFWVTDLVVDETSYGTGFYDFLRKACEPRGIKVHPFNFAGQGSKEKLYRHYVGEFGAERIHYPNTQRAQAHRKHQKFVAQHLDLQKEVSEETRKIKFHRPLDQPNSKDDYCDSGALFCWIERILFEQMPELEASGDQGLGRGRRRNPMLGGRENRNPLLTNRTSDEITATEISSPGSRMGANWRSPMPMTVPMR